MSSPNQEPEPPRDDTEMASADMEAEGGVSPDTWLARMAGVPKPPAIEPSPKLPEPDSTQEQI